MLVWGTCLVFGQPAFEVISTDITLYRDGLLHCQQEISVNSFLPEISIELISESPQNILLLDENLTTIDYQVSGKNLTAFSLGAETLYLEYDTMQLTQKEAEVWTLLIDYAHEMTIRLPSNSTIVYLNEIPLAIETIDNTISLSLSPGNWEISYILSLSPPTSPSPTPTNTPNTPSELPVEYLVVIIVASIVVAIFGLIFFNRKRKPNLSRILKENPQLAIQDQQVIEFLLQKGGKAFEAELREKFPDMPRTSLWRLVRRLERLDIVEIKKIGLENQVQIK